ncbi:MAG: RIP metalloprotease RseP [Gammaproteobacteria bacterium]|nr:RIP metalloprotease RseP [Gammaproteobacteria bacterium]
MISPQTPFEYLTTILAFIVAIGVLVAVHEFGHFWVARRLGFRVLRFSIGFGRALWSRTSAKDGVEYVIAALPLGGYVKLLDEREGNVPPSEAHRAFNRQPVWKRILVLLAGPAFNLVFALAMYWALFAAGVPALRPFIGEVAPGSVAAEAGLRAGDQIVAVKGSRVETLEAATLKILEDMVDDGRIAMRVRGSDGAERDLELVVGSRARELTEPEALFPGLGFQIGRPRIPAVIANVREGSPGERAGLRSGDEIVGFDGQPIEDFTELVRLVEPRPGQEVVLEVRRDGRLLEVPVTLGAEEVGGRRIGRIGVEAKMEDLFALQKYGVAPALGQAAMKTWDMSIFTLQIVGRILTGDVSLKAISGPISIAETTGFAARQGWRTFLSTLAIISISLGILNLLPIPILDGGQILYQLAELVRGRPVSERALLVGQQIGIAMLLLMMTIAFYNDIARHLN